MQTNTRAHDDTQKKAATTRLDSHNADDDNHIFPRPDIANAATLFVAATKCFHTIYLTPGISIQYV